MRIADVDSLLASKDAQIAALTQERDEARRHAANWVIEAERLRAELETLRHARDWQPIETASRGSGVNGPQDTRHPDYVKPPKLLVCHCGELHIAYWDWYYAEDGDGFAEGFTHAWCNDSTGTPFPGSAPTHWMLLPAAPTEAR